MTKQQKRRYLNYFNWAEACVVLLVPIVFVLFSSGVFSISWKNGLDSVDGEMLSGSILAESGPANLESSSRSDFSQRLIFAPFAQAGYDKDGLVDQALHELTQYDRL